MEEKIKGSLSCHIILKLELQGRAEHHEVFLLLNCHMYEFKSVCMLIQEVGSIGSIIVIGVKLRFDLLLENMRKGNGFWMENYKRNIQSAQVLWIWRGI